MDDNTMGVLIMLIFFAFFGFITWVISRNV